MPITAKYISQLTHKHCTALCDVICKHTSSSNFKAMKNASYCTTSVYRADSLTVGLTKDWWCIMQSGLIKSLWLPVKVQCRVSYVHNVVSRWFVPKTIKLTSLLKLCIEYCGLILDTVYTGYSIKIIRFIFSPFLTQMLTNLF